MHLITLFTVSAIALAFLVSFRMLELAIGRDIIPLRVRDALDARVVRFIALSRRSIRSVRTAAKHELHKVPVFILHGLVVVWAWALKQTLKAVTVVQGRGDGRTRGTVAAHLESVRAYEKQLRM